MSLRLPLYGKSLGHSLSEESLASNTNDLSCRFTREAMIIESCKQLTLEEATENESLFEALKIFSKAEHAEENLMFVAEVAKFKQLRNPALAQKIVKKFINDGSSHQINISYEVRIDILKNIEAYRSCTESLRSSVIDCDSDDDESHLQDLVLKKDQEELGKETFMVGLQKPTTAENNHSHNTSITSTPPLSSPRVNNTAAVAKPSTGSSNKRCGELDFSIFDAAYDIVAEHIKNETLSRFNKSGALNRTTIINPLKFRWLLTILLIITAVLFIAVGALSVVSTLGLRKSYASDVELEEQGSRVIYYDALLTDSARLYSYSAEDEYRENYDKYSPLIEEAINNVDSLKSSIGFGDSVREYNDVLVRLEKYAFGNASAGNLSEAQAIFQMTEYLDNKESLSLAIDNLQVLIDDAIENNVKKTTITFIVTIALVVLSLLYIMPTTVILFYVERQHTNRMIELAKALDRNLRRNVHSSVDMKQTQDLHR